MPKLINDIRISGLVDLAQHIHELGPEQPKFLIWKYVNVVERYFLMLLSVRFDAGHGSVFHLEIDFDLPHKRVLPRWTGTCRVFNYGIDLEVFRSYSEELRQQFFISIVHSMLTFVAKNEGLNQEQIDWAQEQLIEFGEKLEIIWARKVTRKYDVKVAFNVDTISKLVLSIVEIHSGKTFTTKIVDLDEHTDALKLVSRVSITGGAVLIYPRKNDLGLSILKHYWPRLDNLGFHSGSLGFISIPLSNLIKS